MAFNKAVFKIKYFVFFILFQINLHLEMQINTTDYLLKIYLPSELLRHVKTKNNFYVNGEIKSSPIKNSIYEIFIENFSNETNLQNLIGKVGFNGDLKNNSGTNQSITISIDKNKSIKYKLSFEKKTFVNSNSKCMVFFYEKIHQNTIKAKLYRHKLANTIDFDSENVDARLKKY
jgi:hypothetical protein